jgi:hypothetical protein
MLFLQKSELNRQMSVTKLGIPYALGILHRHTTWQHEVLVANTWASGGREQ